MKYHGSVGKDTIITQIFCWFDFIYLFIYRKFSNISTKLLKYHDILDILGGSQDGQHVKNLKGDEGSVGMISPQGQLWCLLFKCIQYK